MEGFSMLSQKLNLLYYCISSERCSVQTQGKPGILCWWAKGGWDVLCLKTWQSTLFGSLSTLHSPAALGTSGMADETSRPKDV